MACGTLFLVPTGLGGSEVAALVPQATLSVVRGIRYFIAENPKSARAFLKAVGHPAPLQDLRIETLDEHTPESHLGTLLQPLQAGTDCGLLSEAGCPAVADPGAPLVRVAHACAMRVRPLVGPSAILLALMAAGMDGQRFSFHGYLPVERTARASRLAALERDSEQEQATQIFIEAPYRNDAMLQSIVEACRPDTLLCVATDLTLPGESVRTQSVATWKASRPSLDRRPTVFLLFRPAAPRAHGSRRR